MNLLLALLSSNEGSRSASMYCTHRGYEGGCGLLQSGLLPVQAFEEWVGHHVCHRLQASVIIRVEQLERGESAITSEHTQSCPSVECTGVYSCNWPRPKAVGEIVLTRN